VVQPSHNQCKLDHIAKPPLIVLGVIWPPRHNQQERVAEPIQNSFGGGAKGSMVAYIWQNPLLYNGGGWFKVARSQNRSNECCSNLIINLIS
jgi:hypothetical protein